MATMWWKKGTDFDRDLKSADVKKVRAMYDWARCRSTQPTLPAWVATQRLDVTTD
jgi:hypothetical protein